MRPGKTSIIGRPFFLCILLTFAAWPVYPVFSADAAKEKEREADIVYRCYNQMGEFGAEGVDACVKGEQTAMRELAAYPPDADRIVQRCTERLEGVGWQLIKSCVDRDMAAVKKKD